MQGGGNDDNDDSTNLEERAQDVGSWGTLSVWFAVEPSIRSMCGVRIQKARVCVRNTVVGLLFVSVGLSLGRDDFEMSMEILLLPQR